VDKAGHFLQEEQPEYIIKEIFSFLKENLLPMQKSGHLELITNEGYLVPGIEIKFFHGHTRGQIIPHIHYQGRTIVFVADLLPTAAHVPLPYIMSYDIDPLKTLNEKQTFFRESLKNNFVLFLEHDLNNECCTIKEGSKGYEVDRAFSLDEVLYDN